MHINMFEKWENDFENRIKNNINGVLQELKKDIDTNTPIDTGTLIEGNKIENAKKEGDLIKGKVYNETPYAGFVEYGLGRPFKYHKNGVVFYVGVGARMFTRAFDKIRMKIKDKIIK